MDRLRQYDDFMRMVILDDAFPQRLKRVVKVPEIPAALKNKRVSRREFREIPAKKNVKGIASLWNNSLKLKKALGSLLNQQVPNVGIHRIINIDRGFSPLEKRGYLRQCDFDCFHDCLFDRS